MPDSEEFMYKKNANAWSLGNKDCKLKGRAYTHEYCLIFYTPV